MNSLEIAQKHLPTAAPAEQQALADDIEILVKARTIVPLGPPPPRRN